ncbi:WYL domain-containing protein [Elizabethkingia meningoseptica]|uniref:WYL domain-containing protein n=1 Tax=Elizabethkingia meningoseptica TaxID=238 RepID=A0A1V3U592_ELIME|nr:MULTISPECIES: WYL domain-containing protein [Elizabethkingia]AQX14168.1 WYL domain-containing protein [Elizabethkingia meningoseptica]MBG0512464.1 WYL domain-containing protein [Elizabethkingia meningoseptica]MDE5435066.1 WYL domain-containing protein [Elizabethkingia meningoseptica]MDE5449024.1 WYL domain-containing protein [Elizabethkingia meningoseptica]MDE5472288.1 WYL domain-containing protein [Elizabethkingia meningoseptica]
MAKREQMLRMKLIEEFIRRKKGASFLDIHYFLSEKFREKDLELSFTERTFQRDKKLINEISGKEIRYNKARNIYYLEESAEEDIFDTILLMEAYRETEGNADIMLFEKRKSRGLHNLQELVQAIKLHKCVNFHYRKFNDDKGEKKTVQPYALKEFRNRWYLLGNEAGAKTFFIKTYGLDRMTDLQQTAAGFHKVDCDVEAAFEHSFGIISSLGKEPENIILSMDAVQGNFLKALPIHHSQKIILDNSKEVRIGLSLVPTYDFIQELLTLTGLVKILEPESLKIKMNELLKKDF